MDEILASIRRIIENGDEPAGKQAPVADKVADAPLRGTSVDATPAPLPRFDIHYASLKDEPDDEVSDDDLRDLEATDFAEELVTEPTSDELSDLHDGVSTTADTAPRDHSGDTSHAQQHGYAVPPPAGNENIVRADGEEDAGGEERAISSRDFSFEFDDDDFEAALRSEETWPAASPRIPDAEHPSQPVHRAAKPPMPESVIEGASALLSAQAGDQVAAAFDDLTRAIRDGQMRSMEEMAREMMRPMLQEWLDDNLPRIVERLVRDEIERIARGPRR
ncbi:PopZ family protein [Aureimonas leprariae]|nr:DUF2497 domain-containing protein [Aureimonas leprariae]